MSNYFFTQGADIFIGGSDPVHKLTPFTQQSRGCGQSGDFIHIPHGFLSNLNTTWNTWGNPAKALVQEWAKFRYGVFDEFGFADDPLYPNFYKVGGQIVPTGTSNVPVAGSWRDEDGSEGCDPETGRCFFQPSIETNDRVTCSLGYLAFLPNVTRWCEAKEALGGSSGRALAPTKHNVLCQGHSALDVILSSDDLISRSPQNEVFVRDAKVTTVVNVVREPQPQYVLVMEASASMGHNDLWKWVSKAARKFITHDLVDGSQMALVTFSNDSTVAHSMIELADDKARRRLADTIPDKYKVQRSPRQRCVICGVDAAMESILKDKEAGGHLILITRGDNGTLSYTDERQMLERAEYYNVKFSSILVPDLAPALSFYDHVAKVSGGKSYVFPTRPAALVGTGLYSRLTEAFQEIRRLDTDVPEDIPIRVHEKSARREEPYLTKGEFSIDTTLGRDSRFGILVNDADDYFIKSIQFADKRGEIYGPYSSLSSDFNVINLKTINFPHDTTAPPFDDVCDIFSFLNLRKAKDSERALSDFCYLLQDSVRIRQVCRTSTGKTGVACE